MRAEKMIYRAVTVFMLFVAMLIMLVTPAIPQSQTVYQGTLYRQDVKIITHSRCAPGSAIASDTVKMELPVDKSEIAFSAEFCGYANFSGKMVFTIPKSITAVLKNDSVLTFQSPAKADISVTTSGSGNQTALLDSTFHLNSVSSEFLPGVGQLTDDLFAQCPVLSLNQSDYYFPKKPGPFSLSATAACSELDFLVGYPNIYTTRKDTLVSYIFITGHCGLTYSSQYLPDFLLHERATLKHCFVFAYYKFVKQDSLERISVWQDIPFYSADKGFSSNRDDVKVEMDSVTAEIISASPDSIVARVPAELVGDRGNINKAPEPNPRDVVVVISVKRQNVWREAGRRRMRFVPPRPLLYDEVTRANPPLVQATFERTGPRWRQAFMFLGNKNDGTVAVRLLNTSTRLAPLTLLGKVISPPKLPNYPRGELFDKNNDPTYGNLLNIGNSNAGIQFGVAQDGWYLIAVEAQQRSTTGGSAGPLPAMYQIHLAGNIGLPRKIINGQAEVARAIRLDTYFNHPAPRAETLVNAGSGASLFAETGLFKFANPVTTSPFALAVLFPPAGIKGGFPFGFPPVRARGPARAGLFPSGAIDLSAPMAQTPAIFDPNDGDVIDLAQVPIPASVVAPGPPGGIGAILGSTDGNSVTLPFAGYATVILDMGSGQEIVDAVGADLSIICSSGSYDVAISQTPFDGTFVNLGSGTGTQNFDLAASGLTVARYVRLTASVSATIDAVQALNFLSDELASSGPISDVASATITMRRNKATTNALDPMLELIAPDGSALGKNESSFGDDTSQDKSDAALINKDLNQSGFYRYLGRGYDTQPDAQAFGTFYTRLETGGIYDPAELVISQESESATTAQKKGQITATRQRDSYLFQAAPGSTVRIAVYGVDTTPLADPVVELYDPEDFFIAANDDYPQRGKRAALSISLPKHGRSGTELPNPSTYRIVVLGVDGYNSTNMASGTSKAYSRKVNGGHYELKVFTGAFESTMPALQPQVTAVTPNILAAGAVDQTLTIAGQNFANDAVLTFNRSGITIKSLQVVSTSELKAIIQIRPDAYLGMYDITITQGNNLKATAANGLQVKASLGKIVLSWQAPAEGNALAPPTGLNGRYGTHSSSRAQVTKTGLAKNGLRHIPKPPSVASTVVQELEPNNLLEQAQKLPADSVLIVKGQAEVEDSGAVDIEMDDFSYDDIEDLYQIVTPASGLIAVLSQFNLDCDLYLLDETGEIIEFSVEGGNTTIEFVALEELPAGTYYLGVTIYDADLQDSDSTPYQLEVFSHMGPSTPAAVKKYHIYRSSQAGAKTGGKRIATVNAGVTEYADPVLANGAYYYQVTAEYEQGESAPSNEVQSYATKVDQPGRAIVNTLLLSQNHPNPFNPNTTLAFTLPERAFVTLAVYDVLGKELETLVEASLEAGEHRVQWNPGDLPSGVYLARLKTRNQIRQIKMMYLK